MTTPLRVVAVLPDHAPHFGRDWAKAAQAAGVDVVTLEFVHRLTLQEVAPTVAADGARYQVLRLDLRPTRMTAPLADRLVSRRVGRALGAIDRHHGPIDLLHTHYYHQTRWVRRLPRPYPYVHTEHSLALLAGSLGSETHYPLSRAGIRTARRCFDGAACAIAVSRLLARSIDQLGLAKDLVVLSNPIDAATFAPTETARRDTILSVGRLATEKRPDLVVRGFAHALRQRPGFRLEMIGKGPLRPELDELVSELGIGSSVTFLGHVAPSEVAEKLQQAAVYVNTSKEETLGVAVAEALVAGVPVVATRGTAVEELITPQNGWPRGKRHPRGHRRRHRRHTAHQPRPPSDLDGSRRDPLLRCRGI